MIEGFAVAVGVAAGGVSLAYLLYSAHATIVYHRWPFFVPSRSVTAWQQDPGLKGGLGGLVIVISFIVAFTAVPLMIGGFSFLAAQALMDALP